MSSPNSSDNWTKHKCSQCSVHTHGLNKKSIDNLLHNLPFELKARIIWHAIVPQSPCIKHVFQQCHNPLSCKDGAHPDIVKNKGVDFTWPHLPCPYLTNRDTLFRTEGHKAFFRSNVFVFNWDWTYENTDYAYVNLPLWMGKDQTHMRFRDPIATGLLDFIDGQGWQAWWRRRHEMILETSRQYPIDILRSSEFDKCRYEIEHIVIKDYQGGSASYSADWDWPLKVDWTTLPKLKTLCIDLQAYSRRHTRFDSAPELEQDDRDIADGAKRMECLQLKSLIIHGLCSWFLRNDDHHKQRMDKLFRKALDKNGVLEFQDEADEIIA
ncbi:hypothetical protein EG329_009302 [Mollisiaceae sp. DMI_Dod_QoI]|nr:hypothetical protein EG329_009302 [Helotiales sp. DMI_Dod_QoI]